MYTKAYFPECFPDNFVGELKKIETEEKVLNVFRVSKNGKNDRAAFKSTYEEYIAGEITDKDLDPKDFLINYSTSCNYKKGRIRGILKMCMKRNPKALILEGSAIHECGPSQITKKRIPERRNDGHVDWWLYKDSNPQDFFEIYTEEQNG